MEKILQIWVRADALLAVGRYEDALPLFARVATVVTGDEAPRAKVGYCLRMLSRDTEALAVARETVAAFPDSPAAHYEVALSLLALGQPGGALEAIQQSVRLDPDGAVWARAWAKIAADAQEFDQARVACERACALEPDNPYSWDVLGVVAGGMGDYREAVRCCERAIALRPQDAKFVHRLAWALEGAGDWDAAIESYWNALRLDPRDRHSARNLLTLTIRRFGEVGDRDGAVAAITEYLDFYRALADTVDGMRTEIDSALSGAATNLARLGMHDEALSVVDELIARGRQDLQRNTSAQDRPAQDQPARARLADRLLQRGRRLADLCRHEEAVAATNEAISRFRTLATDSPDDYVDNLADALHWQSRNFARLERRQEAGECAAEAVTICRSAVGRWPRLRDDLAWALCNHADRLAEADQFPAAMSAITEAVELWRVLYAETNADKHLYLLAGEVGHLADLLVKAGRHAEAIGPVEESVELFRRCVAADPHQRYYLDNVLETYGTCLTAVGRHAEALVILDEAIGSLRGQIHQLIKPETNELDDKDPCRKALATSLDAAAISLAALGRADEAAAAIAAAVAERDSCRPFG